MLGRESGSRKWPECSSDRPEGSFLTLWWKDYGNRCDVQLQRKHGSFFFLIKRNSEIKKHVQSPGMMVCAVTLALGRLKQGLLHESEASLVI